MLITILNIYNPLNNIKFTKEKKSEKKNLPVTWFLESKVPYKKKKKKKRLKKNYFIVDTVNTNYYLKYL